MGVPPVAFGSRTNERVAGRQWKVKFSVRDLLPSEEKVDAERPDEGPRRRWSPASFDAARRHPSSVGYADTFSLKGRRAGMGTSDSWSLQ
jgi:hypothetical protein